MTEHGWFEVDHRGLAATIEQPERVPLELYQNAVDEDVHQVVIELEPIEGRRGFARILVTDDSPDGFADLTESYVLYAPSKKRDDPTKRGRMNIGEKRLLSLCESAAIVSTTGTVLFHEDGTRERTRTHTSSGTEFRGVIRLRKAEVAAAVALLRMVVPPLGVTVTVNGEEIPHRVAVHNFRAQLSTVLPDEAGNLTRRSRRSCTVSLFDPLAGEEPSIFEMGIPVVEGGTAWHIDVGQRVPVNTERDNVPPAYLRELRTLVLNEVVALDMLRIQQSNAAWVQDAIRQPNVAPEAVAKVVEQRFGDRVVIFDPSDMEANNRAVAEGYTVVRGRSLPKEAWEKIREHEIMLPAGRVTPTRTETFGEETVVRHEDWTPGMRRVVAYACEVGAQLLGVRPTVTVRNETATPVMATYGPGRLMLNLGRLGHRWFDQPDQEKVDGLLIHEFAHHYGSDHLDHRFHDACCALGARLRTVDVTLADFEAEVVR